MDNMEKKNGYQRRQDEASNLSQAARPGPIDKETGERPQADTPATGGDSYNTATAEKETPAE